MKIIIIFQNRGYQGLYGELGAKEIHSRKGLKKNQQILDHMGSTELLAVGASVLTRGLLGVLQNQSKK